MNEYVKDALRLCKDGNTEKMTLKRNFCQKLHYCWLRMFCCRYKYPVLYSDGGISKAKCERIGRIPLGIIFENHLITLKDSPKDINWYEAMEYCQKIKIFGQSCDAGKWRFWRKYEEHKKSLNAQLKSLGGEPLKYEEGKWSTSVFYWTSSVYNDGCSWVFYRGRDDDRYSGGFERHLNDGSEHVHHYVRPVLNLSALEKMTLKRNFCQKLHYHWLRMLNCRYKYPVLYSDRTISNAKYERFDRKPLGIIFENHLITLKDSPEDINWYEAMEYCQKIKIFGQSCEAGKREFWEKCIGHEEALNVQLKSLGGEPFELNDMFYWSSSEYNIAGYMDYHYGWSFNRSVGTIRIEGTPNNFIHGIVRPVLDLSKVSL